MKKQILILAACFLATSALASEAKLEKIKVATDLQSMDRGAEALMTDCHSCHSMKYIKYRDLVSLGISKEKVDEWRGDQPLDGPLTSQLSEEDAMQSYAKVPPDLSLMAKARNGGASYVYSYLLGYYNTPEGEVSNHIFPETKMPDILGMSFTTEAADRAAIQGKAHDIVSFLEWAADPHAQERRQLGYYVMIYLFVLSILLYFVKNQIWARLK